MGDDVVVAVEDPVREPVVAHELPDVLDRVQLGRARWQRQDGDVRGTTRARARCQPARSRMRTAWAPGATVALISARCSCIAGVSQNGMTIPAPLPLGGADCAEDVGPGRALVVRGPRPGTAARPPAGELVLLPDPCLVLEPELYALAGMRGPDLRHALRESFLKASACSGSWA